MLDAVGVQLGDDSRLDLVGSQLDHVESESLLERDVLLELSLVLFGVGEDEVAALQELDVGVELVLERREIPTLSMASSVLASVLHCWRIPPPQRPVAPHER